MTGRRKIVAGNWKMNLSGEEASALFSEVEAKNFELPCELIVFPPALYVQNLLLDGPITDVGVQNFYPKDKGAFTGEISVSQAISVGAKYCLIGHSERRMYFSESNEFLKEKVDAAIEYRLHPVFCCGEPLEVRELGKQLDFVAKQLEESLFHLTAQQMADVVIAYEPIWAIGTGVTASSAQAEEMHLGIRNLLKAKYGEQVAQEVPILYGGSCNPSNAKELFSCPNVDGGLIGGAALDAASFIAIANSY